MIGTSVWPELQAWDRAILFIETSEEAPPPKILERTLRTLAEMNILGVLGGIIFGRPGGHSLATDRFGGYDDALARVVSIEQGLTDLPIITGMDLVTRIRRSSYPMGCGRRSIVTINLSRSTKTLS
jgi:muramoyltetrapeptide carboxypeptidase LdcA involved in peptidoglycan recycling